MKTTSITLNEEELKILEKKAKELGLKISQFVKMSALLKAREK